MLKIEEHIELFLLGSMLVISVIFTIFMKRKVTSKRLQKLESRPLINLVDLAKLIATETQLDLDKIQTELSLLAKALNIPVGKLRPYDLIEELVGRDFYAGDALIEIEARLQSSLADKVTPPKLTVLEVVKCLLK